MKIEIESREGIITRAKEPFRLRTALISITDADNDFVVLEHKPCYILQLKFDDVSSEIFEEALGRMPTKEETVMLSKKFHMFTDEQALKIAEFFMSIKVELLICQCEYGQSRSAGVAAAIMQFKCNNGIEIFADERYYPNRLVYNKLFDALTNTASYEEKVRDGGSIKSFKDEYRFLSNFYQHPVEYKGLIYPNAESAFQAQKCSTDEERIKYTTENNPGRAKRMGRKEPNLPDDWNIISSDIMEGVLRAKFAVPELSKMLTDTYDLYIEEGNTWHDNYWGNCHCDKCKNIIGKNMLGELLMKIRADLMRGELYYC